MYKLPFFLLNKNLDSGNEILSFQIWAQNQSKYTCSAQTKIHRKMYASYRFYIDNKSHTQKRVGAILVLTNLLCSLYALIENTSSNKYY